jgi:hypothetical protein
LPSAREFAHEFVLHYFAAEGRLWRTLAALVLHPGRLTIEYLKGRKRKYVLPLRLYLTVSVVFFLLLRLAVAPATERVTDALHRSLTDGHSTLTIMDLGFGKAERKPDGSVTCDLPNWLCKRITERVLQPPGELERRIASVPTEVFSHLSTAVFVLLPLFAFLLQLVYPRRTYGEHFLFALHLHSFWFLVLLVLLLPLSEWIQMLIQVYLIVYSVMALHAVYASRWWAAILRAIPIGLAYATSLLVATIVIGIWALIA